MLKLKVFEELIIVNRVHLNVDNDIHALFHGICYNFFAQIGYIWWASIIHTRLLLYQLFSFVLFGMKVVNHNKFAFCLHMLDYNHSICIYIYAYRVIFSFNLRQNICRSIDHMFMYLNWMGKHFNVD